MNTINLQHKLATDFYIDYRVAENGVIIDEKYSTQAPVVDPGKQIMKHCVGWWSPSKQHLTNNYLYNTENPVLKDLSGKGNDFVLHGFEQKNNGFDFESAGVGKYPIAVEMPFSSNSGDDSFGVIADKYKVYSPFIANGMVIISSAKNDFYKLTGNTYRATVRFKTTVYCKDYNIKRVVFYFYREDSSQYGGLQKDWFTLIGPVNKSTYATNIVTMPDFNDFDTDTSDARLCILAYCDAPVSTRVPAEVTVEILPENTDRLYFNGSQYGVCKNTPLLTDYTVVAQRAYDVGYRSTTSLMCMYNSTTAEQRGFLFSIEQPYSNSTVNTGSETKFSSYKDIPEEYTTIYQKRGLYCDIPLTDRGDNFTQVEPVQLTLACETQSQKINTFTNYFYGSIGDIMLFDKSLTKDEIQYVKDNCINKLPNLDEYISCSTAGNHYSNGVVTLTACNWNSSRFLIRADYFAGLQEIKIHIRYTPRVKMHGLVLIAYNNTIQGDYEPSRYTVIDMSNDTPNEEYVKDVTFDISTLPAGFTSLAFHFPPRNAPENPTEDIPYNAEITLLPNT